MTGPAMTFGTVFAILASGVLYIVTGSDAFTLIGVVFILSMNLATKMRGIPLTPIRIED